MRLMWMVLLVAPGMVTRAQVLADFETPGTSPPFTGESAAVVANPDKLGINPSDSVGYYKKASGNWHWVRLHFPDTVNIGLNNTLSFKLRTSTQGRIFAKFYLGSQYFIENWCPDYSFRPSPDTWTECTMDLTAAMGMGFTRLDLAACVDNPAEADVWFDDVKLSNPLTGDGTPHVSFNASNHRPLTGEEITFDASASYDYDGEIVGYQWDFGDGATGSGKIISHSYASDSVYSVSLAITDNDGKAASLSRYVFVVPSGGKISVPRFVTASPETNRKVEALFHINGDYSNEYDPDEVRVDAVITLPDGDTMQIPCFYYMDVKYDKGKWVRDTGFQCWMLRFSSAQEGLHTVKIKLTDGDGYSPSDDYEIDIAAGSGRGVIRADTVNSQYYRHSTGEPFYPLGINIGWNSIENYSQIIQNLSWGNANTFRYWHTPFAGQALEWDENYYRDYDGLGRYSQEAAAMSDSLLELCEARNVYMQLVLFQHGLFSENVDAMWESNPYNAANGGFVERAEEYFYNDECKAQAKKLLRYVVARWAWSTHLFAWEFFNEVQFTGIHNSQSPKWFPGVLSWHSEMGRYIESIDAYDHLQTTSASTDQLSQLDGLSVLDNLQYHLYEGEPSLLNIQAELDYRFREELLNTSVINGEYGTNLEADTPFDTQRNAIWNGIMTQVPRYMWVWEHYLEASWAGLFSMPALYLSGEDFSREKDLRDDTPTTSHPSKGLKSYGLSTGTKYYGYIYDPYNGSNISGTTVRIPDLPLANYDVSYYLPAAGQVIGQDSVVPYFRSNTLELPAFSKSIAFKLKYRSDYTAPFARAGRDTVILKGGTARLSGELSSSDFSDTLTYLWRIDKKPPGSEFILSDSTGMVIEISPDVSGEYILSLTVNDGKLDSRPDQVSVRISSPPVAIAPNDTVVGPEVSYLRLSGNRSYDPDGDEITYQWVLLSVPPGSDSVILGGQISGLTTLKVDAIGVFVIELTVNDGYQFSLPDTMRVTVADTALGVGIRDGEDFQVFPNPTTGRLVISGSGKEQIERMEVFDLQGRLLMETIPRNGTPGTCEINLKDFIDGPRLVLLKITGTEKTYLKRLLLLE